MDVTTGGLDLGKVVFQVHGIAADGTVVFNRSIRRRQLLKFFERTPCCLVGIEACGSAHQAYAINVSVCSVVRYSCEDRLPKGANMNDFSLSTARLKIRSWRKSDRQPYAKINADPRVRQFLGDTLTRSQSDAQLREFDARERQHGFTFWAVEIPDLRPCIGFIGLERTDYHAHFTPAVEIGWRLDPAYWGQGYATEGASALLKYAFEELGLEEIVAVTVPQNIKSQSVMKRLGMTYAPDDDFDHPDEDPGHPLQRSVLYRIRHQQLPS